MILKLKMKGDKMKRNLILSAMIAGMIFFTGCRISPNWFSDPYYDTTPPSIPTGLYIENGDREVYLEWRLVYDKDVAGYNVYRSFSYNGVYKMIGSTKGNTYFDRSVDNGKTYYYAVTSFDFNGNESELSLDAIYITPRPEGFNTAVFDYKKFPERAGYDFSGYRIVSFNSNDADFFFENEDGNYWLNVWDDTDIQNMGATGSLYDIPFAPSSGWATSKSVKAIPGNTYVIWTWDNHFAKVRVKSITPDRIVFDWSYQTVEGNVDLKPRKDNSQRVLDRDDLR